ncbi:MAG: MFS transporter [Actinomycetaceae bacterium]|nr:MFS transporter [Actinomycetaceae bacterium]MDY6082342.1 MFS transporter [Actinomycetaceae bacterium]
MKKNPSQIKKKSVSQGAASHSHVIPAHSKPRAQRSSAKRGLRTALRNPSSVTKVFIALLAAQFVGSMSNTIVGNALPVIIAQIGGNASQYTWIVTSALLANTITTPIVGKLADLFDKKKLFMASLLIFAVSSILSGAAQSPNRLIAYRIFQGIGMGMMVTLTMVIMASIVSPRERGRYNGYMSATMAVSTVGGPLIGGFIVDTLGWRWTFWISVPFVLATVWVTFRQMSTMKIHQGKARIDFLGIALISAASAAILIWISGVGSGFAAGSMPSIVLLSVFVVGAIAFVITELLVKEPLIPLTIFRVRTVSLAIVAYLGQGMAMFATSVFFGQYFQYGRGYTPTVAGLLSLPLVLFIMATSTVVGRRLTLTGRWKPYVLSGTVLMVVGMLMFLPVRHDTPLIYIAMSMVVMGIGAGAAGALLVAVQNLVPLRIMGATTSTILFFRTLAGAFGIQVLGKIYATSVEHDVRAAFGSMFPQQQGTGALDLAALPDDVERVVRMAYGNGLAPIFVVMAAVTFLGVIAVMAMPGVRLRTTIDIEDQVATVIEEDEAPRPGAGVDLDAGTGVDASPRVTNEAGASSAAATAVKSRDNAPDAAKLKRRSRMRARRHHREIR